LSAAFAFLADLSMLAMGGALKRKEKISGRLGDVLSMMYLASATLKRYEDMGRVKADLPLVRWSVRDALYHAQQALDGIFSNFPVKSLATLLRWTIFPLGMSFRPPLDSRNRECAQIALEPGAARDRLTAGMYIPKGETDATGILEAAFVAAIAGEPIDRKLRDARKQGIDDPHAVLTAEELVQWQRKEALRKQVIKVDDFPQDFGRAEAVQRISSEKSISVKAAWSCTSNPSTSSTARARRSSSPRTAPARSPPAISPRRQGAPCSRGRSLRRTSWTKSSWVAPRLPWTRSTSAASPRCAWAAARRSPAGP